MRGHIAIEANSRAELVDCPRAGQVNSRSGLMTGWLGFNDILSMQVAAIETICLGWILC